MAWGRLLAAVAAVAWGVMFATALTPAPGGAAAPGPASMIAAAAEPPEITLERGHDRVVIGHRVTYRITVTNPDAAAELTTTVRASVPPRLGQVTVSSDGEVAEGYVTWQVSLPAGQHQTLQLTGVYAATTEAAAAGGALPAAGDRVTVTACVLTDGGRPHACDTDLAALVLPSPWLWWATAAAALAAAAVAAVLVRRVRSRRAGQFGARTRSAGSEA